MAVNTEEESGDEEDERLPLPTGGKRRKLAKGAEYLVCVFCGASEKDSLCVSVVVASS